MTITVIQEPSEYKTIYWRSLINTWVRTNWFDVTKQVNVKEQA